MVTIVFKALVIATLGLFIQLGSAYFEVDIQKIEQLSDTKYLDYTGLKLRKHNKTRKVYGNVTSHVDFGNDILTEVRAFKKQGGEYRLMPFKLPRKPFCDALNEDTYVYPEVVQLSSFPKQPVPCPFPPGTFEYRGAYLKGVNAPLMIIPSGDYAGEMIHWKDDVEIFRFRAYASIVNI